MFSHVYHPFLPIPYKIKPKYFKYFTIVQPAFLPISKEFHSGHNLAVKQHDFLAER